MPEGRVIALGIAEGGERGHADVIGCYRVEGLCAPMPDVGSGCGKERLGVSDRLGAGQGRGGGLSRDRESLGQALNLANVEHGVGFQEANALFRLLARALVPARLGGLAHVDDLGPALAAPDLSPKLLGLAVGHPGRGAVALLDRLKPEDQRIYASVGFTVGPPRSGDALAAAVAPGLRLVCLIMFS